MKKYTELIRDSNIFTEAEKTAIIQRLSKDYSDPNGIFSNRIRPKLKEIKKWTKYKRVLKGLLKQKHNHDRDEELAKPNEVKSFDEFSKDTGY